MQCQVCQGPRSVYCSFHMDPGLHLVHVCPAGIILSSIMACSRHGTQNGLGVPFFLCVYVTPLFDLYWSNSLQCKRGLCKDYSQVLREGLYQFSKSGFWTSKQEVWQGNVRQRYFAAFVSPLFCLAIRAQKSGRGKWQIKREYKLGHGIIIWYNTIKCANLIHFCLGKGSHTFTCV